MNIENRQAMTMPPAPLPSPTRIRRQRRSGLLCWLLACFVLPATMARSQEIRPLPAPGVPPWEALHFPKVEQHTRYEVLRGVAEAPSLRS